MPETPKSRISDSPMTNGGVISGSTVITRSSRLARKPVRVTSSAKARPSSVVPAPVSTPRVSEFQAMPHTTSPVRQPRPQMSGEVILSRNSAGAYW